MGSGRRASLLTVVLLTLGSLVTVVASMVAALLWTDWGRARVCSLLNRAITEQIAGRLQVERIDALSLTQLKASGIKIFPPTGPAAIEADTAVIDFSPRKLWAGEYGWSHADISHCLVRVSENENHKTNMEATFKGRHPDPDQQGSSDDPDGKKDQLDLQSMVTSDCTLLIFGGELPSLRMVKLDGIMRVHVLANGDTELRFDRYKGTFAAGLPTGVLEFRDVVGEVMTAGKRLLWFDGRGRSRGAEVAFELDIASKPKTLVQIDAFFPELSASALSAESVSLWSKFSPSTKLDVHYEKRASVDGAKP